MTGTRLRTIGGFMLVGAVLVWAVALFHAGAPVAAGEGLPTSNECAPTGSTAEPSFAVWPHVVVIAFENKDAAYVRPDGTTDKSGVIGNPSAPYITQLAADCGQVVNYHAIQYPSLPNYLAVTGGAVPPSIADSGVGYRGRDCVWSPARRGNPCHVPASLSPSIFWQLGASGWQSYQESMTGTCEYGNDANGLYVQRHNPASYYDALNGVGTPTTEECQGGVLGGATYVANDLPFPVGSQLSTLTWISPNLCDDGHSSLTTCWSTNQIANSDHFLQGFLPSLVQSSAYQAGQMAVFLWWDSDAHTPTNGADGGPNIVPLIVLAKTIPAGSTYTGPVAGACSPIADCTQVPPNHYSVLRTIQDMTSAGTPGYLGHAGDPGQVDLRPAFHLCNAGVADGC
jgi:hypothetical protein